MATSPQADPDSVNGRLADFLCTREEEIIRAWIGRVQTDASIPAESLTTNQLRDHLPRFFDDLAEILRTYGSEAAAEHAAKDAANHGIERWQQGYDLAEMLREIMHLRGVFIYHLRIFEEQNADFGMAARLFANATVHRFLDEMAIIGTEEFLTARQHARREASGLD